MLFTIYSKTKERDRIDKRVKQISEQQCNKFPNTNLNRIKL